MRDGVLSFERRTLRYINDQVYFAVDGTVARKLFSDVFSKFRSWSLSSDNQSKRNRKSVRPAKILALGEQLVTNDKITEFI